MSELPPELAAALAAVEDAFAEVDDDAVDPEIAAIFAELTSAEDAPLEFVSLNRRVREGRITWDDVWRDPREQAGGLRLIHEATQLQLRRIDDLFTNWPDDPENA